MSNTYVSNPTINSLDYLTKSKEMGKYASAEKYKFDENKNSYQMLFDMGAMIMDLMSKYLSMLGSYLQANPQNVQNKKSIKYSTLENSAIKYNKGNKK